MNTETQGISSALYDETTLDISEYQAYLKDMGLTDEQAQEYLRTLWYIVATFVDMGWGVEATQSILQQMAQDSFQETSHTE